MDYRDRGKRLRPEYRQRYNRPQPQVEAPLSPPPAIGGQELSQSEYIPPEDFECKHKHGRRVKGKDWRLGVVHNKPVTKRNPSHQNVNVDPIERAGEEHVPSFAKRFVFTAERWKASTSIGNTLPHIGFHSVEQQVSETRCP
ncbi:hypothetical protein BASA81_013838 [Batrachochytrium salamandrivorans]|nr:hypothetical protein BASA81_013838 [Batrachochytrium salamandrivorans]